MSNAKMMSKVASLLAHAESTNNAEEAAAYTEKAQKLASMYAIDLAMAQYKAAHKHESEVPITRRVEVGEKGRTHKNRFWTDLALAIAHSNDIRCTIAHDNSAVWAYGYPSDIDVLEKLFVSLNVQMVDQCNQALRAGKHKELGVHGRTFRPAFYDGFVKEMDMRLYRARHEAMAEQKKRDEAAARLVAASESDEAVKADQETVTGALVMVKKKERVDEYYRKNSNARGTYRSYGATTPSFGANQLGREAARNAKLGGGATALGGTRKELGR